MTDLPGIDELVEDRLERLARLAASRREPRWTTGQALGFLAAMPGCVLVVAGFAALIAVAVIGDSGAEGDGFTDWGMTAGFGAVVSGLLLTVPGCIVFERCRRRR